MNDNFELYDQGEFPEIVEAVAVPPEYGGDFAINAGESETAQKRELIKSRIEEVIFEFENSGKTQDDFDAMTSKLFVLRQEDPYNTDYSWDQGQVEKMVSFFNRYDSGEGGIDQLRFMEIFTSRFNTEKDSETVNNLTAKALIKSIESGERISNSFDSQIRIWVQNIQTLDKNVRNDLLFAFLDNPNAVDYITANEAINFMVLSDPQQIIEIKKASDAANDVAQAVKNIIILHNISRKQGQRGFDAAAEISRDSLNDLKEKSDNFFIKTKAEQALESYVNEREESLRLANQFDDPELRANYDIYPACAEGPSEIYKRKTTASCVYSKLNDKYAVIYTPEHLVDSFFELDKEGKGQAPERLSIRQILEKEGFKNEEMDEGEYKKLILTYKSLIELPLRDKIEQELGIELKDYSIREQVQFVNFLSSKTVDDVGEVKKFLDKSTSDDARKNRVKSFLSLESGEAMSKNIFGIGEAISNQETADAIFAKYAEIVDLTDKIKGELEVILGEDSKDVSKKEIDSISNHLIAKANDLLINFSAKAKITKNEEDILARLENYQTDLILTASAYKSLKESGEPIAPEDLAGVTFEQAAAGQINDLEKRQMVDIYKENYEKRPKLQRKLIEIFEKKLAAGGSGVRLYMYKKGGKVVAFDRIDDEGTEGKKFTSLNVIKSINGLCFGGALSKASIMAETANDKTIIKGVCDPGLRLTAFYIEQADFVGKGITEDYEGTGETAFHIEINPANRDYYYREYTADQIISDYEKNFSGKANAEAEGRVILKLPENSAELLDKFKDLMNKKGFIVTRYLFGEREQDKGFVYCAFEKNQS